ncbi:MAG: dephospho-CoA kinase [Anaerolineales bacterium]|nr:MAG: dephospho-CoA kinase [Anaerolineales bacterium]
MSAWQGKYAIGLTGNIATGKSVVRKMLEHLGAYGIDADVLSHRAIMKSSPGYQPVIDTFGQWVLGANGEIDRTKLGELVFKNPDAMMRLETIIHPLVRQALDVLIKKSKHPIIVIEAIKLLESDMHNLCDQVWVSMSSTDLQLERLMEKRHMTRREAEDRINAQLPATAKLTKADVVIENDGSFEKTWKQVYDAWQVITQDEKGIAPLPSKSYGKLVVRRATPESAEQIAGYMSQHKRAKRQMTKDDIMAAFGEKAYMLLLSGEELIGLLGWQVENLITRVDDVMLTEGLAIQNGLEALMSYVEESSKELQSEASLLFLPPSLAQHENLWSSLGYQARTVKDLQVKAWQNAVMESMPPGTVLLFKQLRKDRVLRPMQ